MQPKTRDFEYKYQKYLGQLSGIDFVYRADQLGATVSGSGLVIPFYDKPHRISADGVTDAAGKQANLAVSVVLCKYVLNCADGSPADGDWVTYRELKGAGPLMGHFTANTNKIIETTFAGNMAALKKSCNVLGGTFYESRSSYDISLNFDFLPKVPVLLNFNDKDDEFPAHSAILFRQSAEKYLDLECLAVGGTYLVGNLIGEY